MTRRLTSQEKRNLIARRVAEDPYAPLYHFIAPEGNALPLTLTAHFSGKDNIICFIFSRISDFTLGGHCWGHASSTDLLHWTFHPTALSP